jgi:hypothetical protein
MPRTRTERRDFILTVICLVLFAGSLLSSLTGSIRRVIVEPNREAWEIGLDWLLIAIFVASAVLAWIAYRKAVAYIKAEEAEEAEIRRVHAEHAENVTLPRLRRQADDNPHMTPEYRAKLDELAEAHPEFLLAANVDDKGRPLNAADVTINPDGSLIAGKPYHDPKV